jgi:CrcB protein
VAAVSGPALWVWVAVLSGAGAILRFVVDAAISPRLGGRFPYGTLLVNLTGAFALGVLTGLGVSHGVSLLVGAALVGSYSTFSTWMLETLLLAEDGRSAAAAVNVLAQAAAGVALAAAGWALGAAL